MHQHSERTRDSRYCNVFSIETTCRRFFLLAKLLKAKKLFPTIDGHMGKQLLSHYCLAYFESLAFWIPDDMCSRSWIIFHQTTKVITLKFEHILWQTLPNKKPEDQVLEIFSKD